MCAKIKNVLLDRDGTIIRDMNYLSQAEKIEFLNNAAYSLYRLYSAGIKLFLVTNQSGIGRGYFSHKDYQEVQKKIRSELKKYGVYFQSEVHCPHSPTDLCACRKPKTGLWKQLEDLYSIKPLESLVIGDKLSDINFGLNAGLKYSILVLTGKGYRELDKLNFSLPEFESYLELENRQELNAPHLLATDLEAATNWILSQKDNFST